MTETAMAAPETTTAPVKEPEVKATQPVKVIKVLKPSALKLAQHERPLYAVVAEDDATLEDVLKPEYWKHHGSKLPIGTHIEIAGVQNDWWALLRVTASDALWASVVCLNYVPFDKALRSSADIESLNEATDMYIKWMNITDKHCVMRRSDGAILSRGHVKKEQAEVEMRDLRKAMVR